MDKPTLDDARYKTDAAERDEKTGINALIARVKRLMKTPWIAHLIRMFERSNGRQGNHFAASITYFSFLSLVPILMVGFATAGFVLAGQPELIEELKAQVSTIFASTGGETAANLNAFIDTAVEQRFTVGFVALGLALFTGIGWMRNVRQAVRAMWRPHWEQDDDKVENFFVALGKDLFALVVLGLGILLSVALTAVGSAATGAVAELFGVDDVGWIRTVLSIVPIAVAVVASTGIFFFIYTWLPLKENRAPMKAVLKGAIAAAVLFEAFKLLLSVLIQLFSGNATAAVFGSFIVLLLIMNLIARMVLMVAAWIATNELVETTQESQLAVVVRPQYRPRAVPALISGIGVGAAAAWVASLLRREST